MLCAEMELRACEYFVTGFIGVVATVAVKYCLEKRIENQFDRLEQICLNNPDSLPEEISQYMRHKKCSKQNDPHFLTKYYMIKEMQGRPSNMHEFGFLYWMNETGNFVGEGSEDTFDPWHSLKVKLDKLLNM
jgi:hypothetical protein